MFSLTKCKRRHVCRDSVGLDGKNRGMRPLTTYSWKNLKNTLRLYNSLYKKHMNLAHGNSVAK